MMNRPTLAELSSSCVRDVDESTMEAVAPAPVLDPPDLPFITVVMPVRNEEAYIADTLRQLFRQDYDPRRFEILVADGGSTDATRTIVTQLCEEFDNLYLLDNPGQWSSAGRNVGVREAHGDLIVIIDGHCQLDQPTYLADLADAFARSQADCVGRPQPQDVTDASPLQRAIALARASRLGHHPDSHIYSDREGFVPPESVAVAYRRSVFDRLGYFDERFDACEDVEFNHRVARAGMTCFFTPRVQVRYHPRGSLKRLFWQMVRYGRGRVRLLHKHPETFTLPGFVPASFLTGICVGPVLSTLFPMLWFIYFGCLLLYLAVVLSFSTKLALEQRQLSLLPLLAAVFATIHLGAGTGICWEFLDDHRDTHRARGRRKKG